MANEQITFKIEAFEYYGKVQLEAKVRVATKEDAQVVAALFPKSVKVKGTTLTGHIDENLQDIPWHSAHGKPYRTVGYVKFRATFERNGVTGEFNETGLKRYRSFRRNAEKLGFGTEWTAANCKNAFQTETEFENYLTQEA
jgi:hypothetical protein